MPVNVVVSINFTAVTQIISTSPPGGRRELGQMHLYGSDKHVGKENGLGSFVFSSRETKAVRIDKFGAYAILTISSATDPSIFALYFQTGPM